MRRLICLVLFPAIALAQPSGSVQTMPVGKGGTGATNPDAALTNLGFSPVGKAVRNIPTPPAARYVRINSDGTITLLTQADLAAAVGGGAGLPDNAITDDQGEAITSS